MGAIAKAPSLSDDKDGEIDVDLSEKAESEKKPTMNSDYLTQKLVYEDGKLLDEDVHSVCRLESSLPCVTFLGTSSFISLAT